jgi:hypothetical protein
VPSWLVVVRTGRPVGLMTPRSVVEIYTPLPFFGAHTQVKTFLLKQIPLLDLNCIKRKYSHACKIWAEKKNKRTVTSKRKSSKR